MKTTIANTAKFALSLATTIFAGASLFAQPFPGAGDDNTQSLGKFRIVVNPTFQPLMAGYPGYDGAGRLTSPIPLYDGATVIGRSATHAHGDAVDAGGTSVGTAGTIVSDSLFTVQPAGFQGPTYTREVHTEVRSLNMTDGAGSAVRAGTAAPGVPVSPGEVQSLSGPSGNPALDLPASSFFDIFVEVDLPAGGPFAGATLYNDVPLLVENTNVTTFPPQVVYIHGNSSAVPIRFKTTGPGPWTAGDIFGILVLAGHGIDMTNNAASEAVLDAALAAAGEAPVDPEYSTWAPGLTVVSNTFPTLGDDVTQSLGSFTVVVNPAYQSLFAGYPGYSTTTKRFTSPTLYDPATVIGRSDPLLDGSPADLAGVLCGVVSPATVGQSSYSLFPFGFNGPSGTRQVMTKVSSLNMDMGGVAPRVRAGTAAPLMPISPGQVESLSANSANTNIDFPADSFFDIFVEVDLPSFGPIPAFTVTNKEPLIVRDNTVTEFPPKVVYIHGNSTAVPVCFTTSNPGFWNAGDVFGILTLAGHGINHRKGTTDEQEFEHTMQNEPEMRVQPQHSQWGPGLVVAPTKPTITGIQVFPNAVIIEGQGMPNTPYYLTRTFQLAPTSNWQTNPPTPVLSSPEGHFIMNVPNSPSIPQSFFRIAGPPLED